MNYKHLPNNLREMAKGIPLKERLFQFRHGQWNSIKETAEGVDIHVSTAGSEMHKLVKMGLMETERRGKERIFRAIKPIDTRVTLQMLVDLSDNEAAKKAMAEANGQKHEPSPEWMPELARKWFGYGASA